MEAENSSNKQDVIFFFGAGASVDAGIPDTYTFAKDFVEFIKSNYSQLYPHLLKIIERREQFNKNSYDLKFQIDVEQLLDTLRRLINRDKEPLLEFYDDKKFCSTLELEACKELRDYLETFIREKVIVKDLQKLDYLKELLKFDLPLEIYSTNYDTCIEQLSYLTHRRYTDGFNIDWNEKNFFGDFDIKHFKLHGSIIWFENTKTKQCIKIPAQAFYEGKQIELKLIYGESIEPLILYPAQKVEYVEPLTDLQLMFKHRLFDPETMFVIFVGHSFRDEYVVRMLWDAARVNENLHVILISPKAQEIYDDKIRYVNKESKDPSRIQDRVICLPYTFKSIIPQLKNNYVKVIRDALVKEAQIIEEEKKGIRVEYYWQELLFRYVETEFFSRTQFILDEKLHKKWKELKFDVPDYGIELCFKGFMHSLITNYDIETWTSRFNDSMRFLDIEGLHIDADETGVSISFENAGKKLDDILTLFERLSSEKTQKLTAIEPQVRQAIEANVNMQRFEQTKSYFLKLKEGFTIRQYLAFRNNVTEKNRLKELFKKIVASPVKTALILPEELIPGIPTQRRLRDLIRQVERRELEKIIGGSTFRFDT